MTPQLIIVPLEPIESRYSKQWLNGIPNELYDHMSVTGNPVPRIYSIVPEDVGETDVVTPGGFLDFAKTNIWKSKQIAILAQRFNSGQIKQGDVILFTDAWNPGILQVKYMCDLLDIKAHLVGMWHAGSYDLNDTLGYMIKDRTWSLSTERALFHALDVNVFATKFHCDFFKANCLNTLSNEYDSKMLVSGQPHSAIINWFDLKGKQFDQPKRGKLIVFPHRLCAEKRVDVFNVMSHMARERSHTDWEFYKTADHNLAKHDYYEVLRHAQVVFSSSKHEMFGISMLEGMLAGCNLVHPNNLSYPETIGDAWGSYQYNANCLDDYPLSKYSADQIFHTLEMAMDESLDNDETTRLNKMENDAIIIDRCLKSIPMNNKIQNLLGVW